MASSHQAIRKQYSAEVVLALFDAYNQASQIDSVDGGLPLHMVIENNFSDQVALKILSAYPCAAMIPCKTSGRLPLHFAAASSASPRLVEALIAEYPEALHIAVNNLIPRNLVTPALPIGSIKMICRPRLHCNSIPSKQQDVESRETKASKQVASEILDMSKIIESLSNNILKLNTTVEALQQRLDGLESKYFVTPSISADLLEESLGVPSVPVSTEHSVATVLKARMLKLDSPQEVTVCFVYTRVTHVFFYSYSAYIVFRPLHCRKKKKSHFIPLKRHHLLL